MKQRHTKMLRTLALTTLSAVWVACSAGNTPGDAGDGATSDVLTRPDAAQPDTGPGSDAAVPTDADPGTDASVATDADPGADADPGTDASAPTDASAGTDAAPAMDATVGVDAGPGIDATPGRDAAADARPDASADATPGPDAAACMPQSCYSGPAGTAGRGVCVAGVRMCVGSVLGVCTGEITPTSEACNGRDDDCDGMVDELPQITCGVGACQRMVPACAMSAPNACVPGAPVAEICGNMIDDDCNGVVNDGCSCTHVSPTGNDMTGTGSAMAPFRTVQIGINRAGTMGLPNTVCVAAGTYNEDLTMRSGISVLGGYMPGGATWARPGTLTTVNASAMNALGVSFPASVTMPTVIDGFTINGSTAMTSAAITVSGTGAVVSNNVINGNGAQDSYGVNVVGGGLSRAQATLSNNNIVGANAATRSSIGVRVVGATVQLTGSCQTFNAAGQCTGGCGTRGVRGRTSGTPATADSFGVLLDNAPNSVIERSAICSGAGANAAGVRVVNDATNLTIYQNNIQGFGATRSAAGVWAEDCRAASPLISNNALIAGNSPVVGVRADGVRSIGDCHAVIVGNTRIVGGIESANNDANGVLCSANTAGVASRCTVLNNVRIEGAGGGFPPNATGVRCERGSCVRIEGNGTITGQSGINSFGVTVDNAAPVIRQNTIEAGCARNLGIGLQLTNSAARVENNLVFGQRCVNSGGAPIFPMRTDGVRIVSTGLAEPDVHSNDIFGEGPLALGPMCVSRGVAVEANDSVPPGSRGVLRNNVVHPGRCSTRAAIAEGHPLADLRLLENNDLHFAAMGDTLYFDENATAITSIAAVNALMNPTGAANISADPGFVGAPNYRLQMTSPCVNAGTNTGAPSVDFYGTSRPRGPVSDIGAAEF